MSVFEEAQLRAVHARLLTLLPAAAARIPSCFLPLPMPPIRALWLLSMSRKSRCSR